MASTIQGGGFSFSIVSVGGSWKWTVAANNLQGAGQLYQVQDVFTPYGSLYNAAIPIPADVIAAMAESVTTLQNQLAAHMVLVSGSQLFSLAVTEGDSVSEVGKVTVGNNGAFGSFMAVSATSDVPWLTVTPAAVQSIGKNEVGTFTIDIVPSSMSAMNSPCVGHVMLRDNANPPNSISITVNVVVYPEPAILTSASSVTLTWSVSNMTNDTQYLTVSNGGPATSALNFTAVKFFNDSPWLCFSPDHGGPLQAGESVTMAFTTISAGMPFVAGTYSEKIRFDSSNASNAPLDIDVFLNVVA